MVLVWGAEQVSAQAPVPDRAREAVPELAQAVVLAWASVQGPETVKVWEPARERAAVPVQGWERDPARRAEPEPAQAEAQVQALVQALVQGPGSGQAQA